MKNALLFLICGFFLFSAPGIHAEGASAQESASSKEGIEGLLEGLFGDLSIAENYVEPTKDYFRFEFQNLKIQVLHLLNTPSRAKTPRVVIELPPFEKAEKSPAMPMVSPMEEQKEEEKGKTEMPEPEGPAGEDASSSESKMEMPQGVIDESPPREPELELKPGEVPEPEKTKEPEKVSALEEQKLLPVKSFSPGKVKPPTLQENETAGVELEVAKEIKPLVPEENEDRPPSSAETGWNAVVTLSSTKAATRDAVDAIIEIDAEPKVKVRAANFVSGVKTEIEENLTLGETLTLGIQLTADMDQCVSKFQGFLKFCALNIEWPEPIRKAFEISAPMYKGTQAVTRFDNQSLTHAHALFHTSDMRDVVAFLERRFGPPLETLYRIVTPFEGRPTENPTFIWRRNDTSGGVGRNITLEVRKFDDSRGAFPDMQFGLVRLYGDRSQPIFPRVSPREMMLAKFAVN